jgi:hypothetical protein
MPLDMVISASLQELAEVEAMLGIRSSDSHNSATPDTTGSHIPPGALQAPTPASRPPLRSRAHFHRIVERQPLFLDSEGVKEALAELKRLMPKNTDAREMLLRDPSYLLRVQRGQRRIGVNPDSSPDSSYLDIRVPRAKDDE